ncbi:hypothetical protein, partial [Nitratidesulfovibrio liaohensis]|uniref:hypothetical protein n=1 Tax=Nitratidesulfovibrio liaohensis TaxID=2604158 RepID=UPI001AB01578
EALAAEAGPGGGDGQDAEAACVAQGQDMVTGNRRQRPPGWRELRNGQDEQEGTNGPDGQRVQSTPEGGNETGGTAGTPAD